jgi:hypothetical protein
LGAAFEAETVDADQSIDEVFAEVFAFAAYMLAADRSAPDVVDPSRAAIAVVNAVYLDPEVTRVGDRDERRAPGVETGMPRIEVSLYEIDNQTAALGTQFLIKVCDRFTRANGSVYRVDAAFVDLNGNVKLKVNKIA